MSAELYGLVLAGGHSRRMQRDKAALAYAGRPQLARAMDLLHPLVARSFISIRQEQHDPLRSGYDAIVDQLPDLGPIGGIHAALHTHPDKAWLILACDLPFLDSATLARLIAERDESRLATAYRSSLDGMPEPLCAIYEPASRSVIAQWIEAGERCPRKFLARDDVRLLTLATTHALHNVNTPEEYAAAQSPPDGTAERASKMTAPAGARRVHVRYFAVLREQAGRSSEELETSAGTALELYQELRGRRGLGLDPERLRVAVNDEFGDWHARLSEGDTVAFLPPVAGG
jgi:molybdopterin-guanine dinucleotide biosynthesis protein A